MRGLHRAVEWFLEESWPEVAFQGELFLAGPVQEAEFREVVGRAEFHRAVAGQGVGRSEVVRRVAFLLEELCLVAVR